jgi:hypothetical protein
MKRLLGGLLITAAILTTGCLGNTEEEILGAWKYDNQGNPAQHNMQWTFDEGGNVFMTNFSTGAQDTGKYELYMDGTHKVVKIKNTDITDATMGMNGEWHIVRSDFSILVLGIKEFGFQQRDLVRP